MTKKTIDFFLLLDWFILIKKCKFKLLQVKISFSLELLNKVSISKSRSKVTSLSGSSLLKYIFLNKAPKEARMPLGN